MTSGSLEKSFDRRNLLMNRMVPDVTPTQQMISSCSGALITSLFVTPLDVVKTRLQAQAKPLHRGQHFLYCNGLMDHVCTCLTEGSIKPWDPHEHLQTIRFRGTAVCEICAKPKVPIMEVSPVVKLGGTLDAFIKIARNEGLSSLWSGLPPTLVMALPATVIYFTMYDNLRDLIYRTLGIHSYNQWVVMSAGASARVIAATVISPLELIRTKMQSQQLSYKELGRAVKTTMASEGIFSLWRGLSPTLLRDVPFSALYWANYEFLKERMLRMTHTNHPTMSMSFTAGAISGTAAAVITLPFDVVKTHRQIELGGEAAKGGRNVSTTHLIHKIYKEKGYRGLFVGIVPRIIKVAPACAIMISSYEFGKHFFTTYNARRRAQEQHVG